MKSCPGFTKAQLVTCYCLAHQQRSRMSKTTICVIWKTKPPIRLRNKCDNLWKQMKSFFGRIYGWQVFELLKINTYINRSSGPKQKQIKITLIIITIKNSTRPFRSGFFFPSVRDEFELTSRTQKQIPWRMCQRFDLFPHFLPPVNHRKTYLPQYVAGKCKLNKYLRYITPSVLIRFHIPTCSQRNSQVTFKFHRQKHFGIDLQYNSLNSKSMQFESHHTCFVNGTVNTFWSDQEMTTVKPNLGITWACVQYVVWHWLLTYLQFLR